MSTKDTKKERREDAKRARLAAQKKAKRAAAMRKIYGAIAAAVVIALIVFLVANGGKENKALIGTLKTDAKAAGCGEVETFASQGQTHVPPPNQNDLSQPDPQTADSVYNSNPPTSGNHYGVGGAPTTTGVHLNPVPNGVQIHNLEHGHIVIQYTKALPEAIRTALEDFATNHNTWVMMAPRETMPKPLVFTAWTKMLGCATPTDAAAIAKVAEDFRKVFENKGPEHAPGTPG